MVKSAPAKRITDRINALVASDKPLRDLAGNLSKVARYAINEATTLTTEEVEVTLDRLPKKLDGFRIVHLSDLHHSPFTHIDHIARAVTAASKLKPHIVVLTGDFVSHEADYIKPVAKILGELKGKYGSFACLGNHDHWTDSDMVTKELQAAGVKVLVNEGFRFEAKGSSFWLCGVDDHMVGKTDLPSALKGAFPDEMKLLLAHNPIIFRKAVAAGVDLTLSGHTHGGQIKVRDPEKRILPRRKLSSGLHHRKDSQIYITRGIGTVVLPVRFQCPPEISVLTLRASSK